MPVARARRVRPARSLSTFGHRSAGGVRGSPRPRRGALRQGAAASALGFEAPGRPSGPAARRLRRARARQPAVSARAHRRALSRRRRRLFTRARAGFERSMLDARGEMLDALLALIAERHAQFNDTLYQLEPDLKDAPGGLRDVAAARLLRSLGGAPDPVIAIDDCSPGAGRGLPAARAVGPPSRDRPQLERAEPRPAGGGGRPAALLRRRPAAAGRSAHGRVLPPCARGRSQPRTHAPGGP